MLKDKKINDGGVEDCDRCFDELDKEKINSKKDFQKWSIKNHPDKLAGKSPEERKIGEEKFKIISPCYDIFYGDNIVCDKEQIRQKRVRYAPPPTRRPEESKRAEPGYERPEDKFGKNPGFGARAEPRYESGFGGARHAPNLGGSRYEPDPGFGFGRERENKQYEEDDVPEFLKKEKRAKERNREWDREREREAKEEQDRFDREQDRFDREFNERARGRKPREEDDMFARAEAFKRREEEEKMRKKSRRQAHQEELRQAQEQARRFAEEDARRFAEEQARKNMEEQARKYAEEQARRGGEIPRSKSVRGDGVYECRWEGKWEWEWQNMSVDERYANELEISNIRKEYVNNTLSSKALKYAETLIPRNSSLEQIARAKEITLRFVKKIAERTISSNPAFLAFMTGSYDARKFGMTYQTILDAIQSEVNKSENHTQLLNAIKIQIS